GATTARADEVWRTYEWRNGRQVLVERHYVTPPPAVVYEQPRVIYEPPPPPPVIYQAPPVTYAPPPPVTYVTPPPVTYVQPPPPPVTSVPPRPATVISRYRSCGTAATRGARRLGWRPYRPHLAPARVDVGIVAVHPGL